MSKQNFFAFATFIAKIASLVSSIPKLTFLHPMYMCHIFSYHFNILNYELNRKILLFKSKITLIKMNFLIENKINNYKQTY